MPGRDENRDRVWRKLRQLGEDRLQRFAAWLGSRHVADRDRDPLARADDVSKRRAPKRRAQRGDERRMRIRQRRPGERFDHRHTLVGQIDVEPVDAVIEMHAHYVDTLSNSCASTLVTFR